MPGIPWPFRLRRTVTPLVHEATQRNPPVTDHRPYLEHTPYILPKDAEESHRLNFQHYALSHAFGNHYLAPLTQATRTILDVGSGTGIWAMDMARKFPKAHILGVDVSLAALPPNLPDSCLFCQADILQGLPFPDHHFWFTHQRLLVFAIPAPCWPEVVRELVRVTRSQGWIELLEVGTTLQHAGPATERLLAWMRETVQALGIELTMVTQLGPLLRQAGCQVVEAQDLPVPLGSWAGRSGDMLKADAVRVFQTLQQRSDMSQEAFQPLLFEAMEEWEQLHTSYVFHLAYGRQDPL